MAGNSKPIIGFSGIHYGGNAFEYPDGALHISSVNVRSVTRNRIASRRGLARVNRGTRWSKLAAFRDLLLLFSASAKTLQKVATPWTGTVTSVGTLTSPDTRPPQFAFAGERAFITQGGSLKALDSDVTALRDAGGPIAPGFTAAALAGAGSGFLAGGKRVAYRYCIGLKTYDDVQILGPVSGRDIVENTTGGSDDVDLTLRIPPGLTDSHFIQVFRSSQVSSTIQPEDELRLVYERAITADEVLAELVSFTDVVPDELRGEYIYTASNAGEGIQQNNNPPPRAEDAVLFKDRLWLACTTQPHELEIRLLAIGTGGMVTGDRFTITGPTVPITLEADHDFTLVTGGSASQNVEQTAQNIVRAFNNSANADYWAEYLSGPDDVPGLIRIYGRVPPQDAQSPQFAVWSAMNSGLAAWSGRAAFNPQLPPDLTGGGTPITFTLQRVANVVTATVSAGSISGALTVGERIVIFNPSGSFGAGPHIVTGVTGTTFTYAETAANAGPTAGFTVEFWQDQPINQSVAESAMNRLHFSKFAEFEAFPRADWVDVGASDKSILALASTRETLWVFKEDGLFRVTGDDVDTFDVERMDATLIVVNSECVAPFAEQLVAWTNKGIVVLSESSFDIISAPISELLQELLDGFFNPSSDTYGLASQAFIVTNEKERIVRLHLPGSSTLSAGTVEGAGEALEYAFETQTWTRLAWAKTAEAFPTTMKPLAHGLTNPVDKSIFYVDGHNSTGAEGHLWRERDSGGANTFSDDDYKTPTPDAFGIGRVLTWSFQTAKAPHLDKRFDELTVLLDKRGRGVVVDGLTSFKYRFGNEGINDNDRTFSPFGMTFVTINTVDGTVGTAATVSNAEVRISIPSANARGQRLWISLAKDTVDEEFALLGFALLCEVLKLNISR